MYSKQLLKSMCGLNLARIWKAEESDPITIPAKIPNIRIVDET